jgi:hypothetical protein
MRSPTSNPPIRRIPALRDRLTVILGGLFLAALVVSAWVPRDCPVLRKQIIGCPSGYVTPTLTADQQELNRYPHQPVKGGHSFFNVQSQDYRRETAIRFVFHNPEPGQVVILQLKKGDAFQDVALVSHPLLLDLSWPSVGTPDFRLYQRNEHYNTVSQMGGPLLPAKEKLAADQASVREYGLKEEQYTPLESLTSLEGIDYVLTSYSPSYIDGAWRRFERTFDLSGYPPNSQGEIEGAVILPVYPSDQPNPFLLGTIHVDYQRIEP